MLATEELAVPTTCAPKFNESDTADRPAMLELMAVADGVNGGIVFRTGDFLAGRYLALCVVLGNLNEVE